MPDPTREQFDAASKKVMASAPSGLSREQFYALIDKELAGAPPVGEHQPDTYWGGVKKSVSDTFSGGMKAPIVQDAKRAGGNVLKGFTSALNPVNAIKGPFQLVKDAANIQSNISQNMQGHNVGAPSNPTLDTLGQIASGNPDTIAQTSGSILGGVAVAKTLPHAPNAMVRGGRGLEDAGETLKPASRTGAMVDIALSPGGIKSKAMQAGGMLVAPYAIKGAGSILRGAGEKLGGRAIPSGVTPAPPAPVTSPAAPTSSASIPIPSEESIGIKSMVDNLIGAPERRVSPSGELPAGMTNRRMDELLQSKFGGTSSDRGTAAETPSDATLTPDAAPPSAASEVYGNIDPETQPGSWHSGAESGSPEAASARSLHSYEGEMDAGYRRNIGQEDIPSLSVEELIQLLRGGRQ